MVQVKVQVKRVCLQARGTVVGAGCAGVDGGPRGAVPNSLLNYKFSYQIRVTLGVKLRLKSVLGLWARVLGWGRLGGG